MLDCELFLGTDPEIEAGTDPGVETGDVIETEVMIEVGETGVRIGEGEIEVTPEITGNIIIQVSEL